MSEYNDDDYTFGPDDGGAVFTPPSTSDIDNTIGGGDYLPPDDYTQAPAGGGAKFTAPSTAQINKTIGGSDYAPTPGILSNLNKWLRDNGVIKQDLTWGDLLKQVGGLTAGAAAFQQGMAPRKETDFNALRAAVASPNSTPSASTQAAMGSFFSRPMNAGTGITIAHAKGVSPKKFANGGALAQTNRFVRGPGGGQDDKVNAMLSPGEYVFDADAVSALGDGNNEEGARKLDQVRANLRSHKRSAPADSIPPKAKSFQAYTKGAK